MPIRRKKSAASLAAQANELALAVPQVVAHRVARMALSGPQPSARDRKEFQLMVAEKTTAFNQSWAAMFSHAAKANQAFAVQWLRAGFMPGLWGGKGARLLGRQAQRAALGVMAKGLAPVHRKAVANAKRLARTKLTRLR